MDNMQSTPRNAFVGGLADLLKQGKDTANQYEIKSWVPLIGGTGLGDMFLGKAPELVDDISYDGLQAAVRGGNAATGGIGTYGARPAVADAALLGMDMAGIGSGLKGLSKRSASALVDHLTSDNMSMSRREALKKIGGVAGSAALGGGLLRKFGDNVVEDIAPKVVDNIANQATKNYRYNSLSDYLAGVKHRVDLGEHHLIQLPNDEYIDSTEDAVKAILKADRDNYEEVKHMFSSSPQNWENSYQNNVLSPQAKAEMKEFKQKSAALDTIYGSKGSNPKEAWLNNIGLDFNLDDFGKHYDTYIDGPY